MYVCIYLEPHFTYAQELDDGRRFDQDIQICVLFDLFKEQLPCFEDPIQKLWFEMSTRSVSTEEGPPDPISYLRRGSYMIDEDALKRLDSADDLSHSDVLRQRRQDPPARERPAPGQAWPQRDTLSFTRSLIFYGADAFSQENELACRSIQEARSLRRKYHGQEGKDSQAGALADSNVTFQFGNDGVVELYLDTDEEKINNLTKVPNIEEFSKDYHHLVELVNDGSMRSYCFQRLQLLSSAFKMHNTMNAAVEAREQSTLLGTDFYRTLKIDNHIHAAAAPSAKQFVNFVTDKIEREPETEISEGGKTLQEVFDEAGLKKDHLTIDAFSVLADYTVYQRFDNFNAKYSPFRMANMRRIFLKTSNHMGGRYFAELMKIVLNRHETSKGHTSAAEMRLSIYGMERHEWSDLADWMMNDWGGDFPGPVISTHNRWLVQIPRLWRIFRSKPGKIGRTFLEMLENIFVPMFEATLHPDKHPKLAEALKHIVGIDSVDDEGSAEVSSIKRNEIPS